MSIAAGQYLLQTQCPSGAVILEILHQELDADSIQYFQLVLQFRIDDHDRTKVCAAWHLWPKECRSSNQGVPMEGTPSVAETYGA